MAEIQRKARRHQAIAALLMGGIMAISTWLRWPGLTQGGFASHDVAGILHGAMLLHDGALPYVHSIELKAPGTFYLAAWLAGPRGTDIASFQVGANLWALTTLGVIGAVAGQLWGPRAAVIAALVYGLHDAHLDSMDANYVTWAQLPLVAGVGAAMVAPQAKTSWGQWGYWLLAGLLTGAAALLKRPAAVGTFVVVMLALWPHQAPGPPRWTRGLCVLLGVIGVHCPVVLHYAWAGHPEALWHGYVWNRWGLRYIGGGDAQVLDLAVEGLSATVFFLALPLSLACTAVVAPLDRAARRQWLALVVWSAATLAAAWIGGRFYKGYFLAAAAPLSLAAAAPWGLWGSRRSIHRGLRVALSVPLLLLLARQLVVLDHQRRDRARPHDQGGRTIAKVVRHDQRSGDRIWVWGWHLWDVYPFTGMRSASRVYKSLGLLTPPNDDTWRRPAQRLRFVDGPAAQILLDDLEATRPPWIVLGSTVPREQFDALRRFLRQHYVLERRYRLGRVQFWHRADRARASRAARH